MVGTAKRIAWSMSRDSEGHRDYKISFKVTVSSSLEGPFSLLNSVGLPTVGSAWSWGLDVDPYALCLPTCSITPRLDNERNYWWQVDCNYSTRPLKRCQTNSIENPLAEPQKISGSFIKYTKEADKDRNDRVLLNTALEPIEGLQIDQNRPTVVIEQNVAALGLDVFSRMIDTVNDATLWGLPKRTIKLSNASWSRQVYGTCTYYYTRRFEFEVNYKTFDIRVQNKGRRYLAGYWSTAAPPVWTNFAWADKTKPHHFWTATDPSGNVVPLANLDANGNPLVGANPIEIPTSPVEFYNESNFLTLGIPTSF